LVRQVLDESAYTWAPRTFEVASACEHVAPVLEEQLTAVHDDIIADLVAWKYPIGPIGPPCLVGAAGYAT
jgi:hypothetical protein